MLSYEEDEEAAGLLNPIYTLGLFVAAGIYFLFKRYQNVRYRAIPFSIKPPAVRTFVPQSSIRTAQQNISE